MTMREAAKLTLLVSVKSLLLSLQRLVILTTSRHSHGGPTLPYKSYFCCIIAMLQFGGKNLQ
jgi:hypothetical protein